jgi:hypothetical protein
VLPISGASCRHAGTTSARSSPRRRAERSVRSTEPARPGRRRSASGLGTWRMSARSASPDHTARCHHRGCRSPGHRLRRHRQNGPFRSRHHRGAPSRALRPRRDSVASDSLRSARRGRDPSMEGVQPSCQRSVPELRVDFPGAVSTEHGWVSRFTPLHPLRPAVRSPLRCSLPKGRPPDEPLALLVPPREGRLCSDSHHGGPTPPARRTA